MEKSSSNKAVPSKLRLDYEPTDGARPITIENDGLTTRIIVAMPGLYVPISNSVSQMDIFSLIVVPICWIATLLVRACLRLKNPPRAVFEITAERMNVLLRDPNSGETQDFDLPRPAIAEVRVNRYEPGLWLNVTGRMKQTILPDLSASTISQLDTALNSALATGSSNRD